jgi:hypothetical protein
VEDLAFVANIVVEAEQWWRHHATERGIQLKQQNTMPV